MFSLCFIFGYSKCYIEQLMSFVYYKKGMLYKGVELIKDYFVS